ncbi:hypothetical protein T261_3135 [Streptomyces lydicus]|uniref:ATP-binding protein n=2 Tax=Streptomyces chattanoogensis TaxID=66876 RepID=A0A0N0GVZ0_9ACTN|nr:hypothetical protein [Streptomyces chattanoogensis]AJT64805.1 hypothetical protein T261_3135 [Streptomyces lydicus]KPC59370.1 hypothetical protein ADL29_35575 [Streptomyces chattanoogensis]
MKQGTMKTLGAAVLGAAFAVTAAGTASAASPVNPADATGLLGKVSGATKTVSGATKTVSGATKTVSGAAHGVKPAGGDIQTPTNSKGNTLGGVPLEEVKGVTGVVPGVNLR